MIRIQPFSRDSCGPRYHRNCWIRDHWAWIGGSTDVGIQTWSYQATYRDGEQSWVGFAPDSLDSIRRNRWLIRVGRIHTSWQLIDLSSRREIPTIRRRLRARRLFRWWCAPKYAGGCCAALQSTTTTAPFYRQIIPRIFTKLPDSQDFHWSSCSL